MHNKTSRLANTNPHHLRRLRRTGGVALVALAMAACGNSGAASTSGAGGSGSGGAGAGTGGSGSTGTGASSATGGFTGTDASVPVVGDGGGVLGCTPGVEQLVITDCGYPTTTSNPLTATVFSENEVIFVAEQLGKGRPQMFHQIRFFRKIRR